MEKHTLSAYGYIMVVVIILAVIMSLCTPFANLVSQGSKDAINMMAKLSNMDLTQTSQKLETEVAIEKEMEKTLDETPDVIMHDDKSEDAIIDRMTIAEQECEDATLYMLGIVGDSEQDVKAYISRSTGSSLDSHGPNKGVYVIQELKSKGYLPTENISFSLVRASKNPMVLDCYYTNENLDNPEVDRSNYRVDTLKLRITFNNDDSYKISKTYGTSEIGTRTVQDAKTKKDVKFCIVLPNTFQKAN